MDMVEALAVSSMTIVSVLVDADAVEEDDVDSTADCALMLVVAETSEVELQLDVAPEPVAVVDEAEVVEEIGVEEAPVDADVDVED